MLRESQHERKTLNDIKTRPFAREFRSRNDLNCLSGLPSINSGPEHVEGNDLNPQSDCSLDMVWRVRLLSRSSDELRRTRS
jgi:hypothetical protein